jgi:glyoxylase-like metal-dependent hydrolase (beta-lactamase superfamily II)
MTGATLTIRVYNVLFGEAILLTLDDPGQPARHMLVDFGNALAGAPGTDAVFAPALQDIMARTGGMLDLYVMTHEHMDHVQGPMFCSAKLGQALTAQRVWMTASSAPDYYDRFAKAKKQKKLALTALAMADDLALAAGADRMPDDVLGLMELNNPRASRDCVDFIAAMGLGQTPPAAPRYVFRQDDAATAGPRLR